MASLTAVSTTTQVYTVTVSALKATEQTEQSNPMDHYRK